MQSVAWGAAEAVAWSAAASPAITAMATVLATHSSLRCCPVRGNDPSLGGALHPATTLDFGDRVDNR